METEELTIGRVHHGRNIRRTRIEKDMNQEGLSLSLIHISEPTRLGMISYAVFCLKKKKQ